MSPETFPTSYLVADLVFCCYGSSHPHPALAEGPKSTLACWQRPRSNLNERNSIHVQDSNDTGSARRKRAPTMKAAGFVLIILGMLALIYQGITYTHEKQFLKVGPIQAQKQETNTIPISPIFGVIAIVGGGLLVYGAERQR